MDSVFDLVMGGALGHYRLVASADTIKCVAECVYTLQNEKDVELSKGDYSGPHGDAIFGDLAVEREFFGAACSQIIAASFCPLLESLFTRAFDRFRLACQCLAQPNHVRWTAQLTQSDEFKRWSPCWHFYKQDRPPRNDFLKGYRQVLEAIGFDGTLPEKSHEAQVMAALFMYRNKSLHHGYEWPERTRAAFVENLKQQSRAYQRWKDWFFVCEYGGKPWIITSSKRLAVDAVEAVKTIASKLREVETQLGGTPSEEGKPP